MDFKMITINIFEKLVFIKNNKQVFHAAGQPFEDKRISAEEWKDLKAKTPFGNLPILEVKTLIGKTYTYAQSYTICNKS